MKLRSTLLLAFCGLSVLASCKQKDTPDGGSGNNDPQNIREVSQLLRSAGHVPEAEKERHTAKAIGKPTSTFVPDHSLETTGEKENCDKVTQKIEYNYASNSEDFAILDPWPSVLWPGCLIQGKSIRGNNVPAVIPLFSKRQPGRINLQIVSGAKPVGEDGEGLWYEEVQEMRESNVIQAQNNLIRRWQESGVPASTSYTMEVVNSAEEAIIATGLDINKSWGKVHALFATGFDRSKSHVLVKLYQRFYTLSYDDPDGGFKGVFKPTIQQSDLEPYTGPGNPICYISSVSYGRVYYLLFESTESSSVLLTELGTTFSGVTIDGKKKTSEVVSSSRVKMVQRGGDASAGLAAATNPDKVLDFILDGAIPSTKNVGAPISFTVKHLYDAQPVRMSNTLTYSYDKVSFVPRTKRNNLAFFLRDIVIETSANGRWQASNRGHIKVLNVDITYGHLGGKVARVKSLLSGVPEKYLEGGLRSTVFIPIHKGQHFDCGFGEASFANMATITVAVEVLPEAYKDGKFLGIGGSRSGHGTRIVTMKRSFHYRDNEWKALSSDEGTEGLPYRSLTAQRTLDDLNFHIRANFSVFKDNVLIE